MKPNVPGVWEWFDSDGVKRLVSVVDCGTHHGPSSQYLRVYWWGGYYDVTYIGILPDGKDHEWPDRWGKYVCALDSEKYKQIQHKLYEFPTKKQRKKVMKRNED